MRMSVRAISSYSQVAHIISGASCSNRSPLMIISVLSISNNCFGGSFSRAAIRVAFTLIIDLWQSDPAVPLS